MLTGPDGQQNQVFLTPQELQQWQARQQQQQPGQQAPGGAPRPPPAQVQPNLAPVEGVLDTEAKGPNAFLRQIRRNLLPGPEDAEIPKNLVQKLRLRQGQYLTAMAQMRGQKGLVQKVDTVDGQPVEGAPRLPHFNDLTSIDPVEHPLVRTHDETGEEILYVNPGFTRGIKELEPAEAQALLGFLHQHSVRPQFTVRWHWSQGDLAFWDNRATQHAVVPDFSGQHRVIQRVTLRGERPV